MFTLTITIEGQRRSDLEFALDQVKAQVGASNLSGIDSNDTGSYTFQIAGESEPIGYSIGDDDYCQNCIHEQGNTVTGEVYSAPNIVSITPILPGDSSDGDTVCATCSMHITSEN